jgi:hypothetical protein
MTKEKAAQAKPKPAPKAKLTDAERHQRFVDMAHEVEADESQEAFDRAFEKVASARANPAETL